MSRVSRTLATWATFAVTCTAAAPLPSQLCCVCDTSLAAGAPAHGRCLPAIATRGVHARCFVEFAD